MKLVLTIFLFVSFKSYSQKSLYDFGVRGTGDETVAIQEAIKLSAGKTLIIPNDTFNAVTLYGVSKVKLVGRDGAYIQLTNFQLNKVDGFSVQNVIFNGNFIVPKSNTLFQIIDSKNVTIKNCTFQNNVAEGIAAKGSSKVLITHNKIIKTDVGFLGVGANSDFEICYNEIRDGTSDGVAPWGKSKEVIDSNFSIHDNKVYNKPNGSGYLIQYSKNIDVYNNYAEGCSVGFGHDEKADYNAGFMKVVHNTFRRNRVGIHAAINNSLISQNTIDSTREYAMCIGSILGNQANTFNNVVSENTVINPATGIRLIHAKNCVVDNNTVVDRREKKITYDGIVIMFGDSNTVSNNTCNTVQYPFLINTAKNTCLFGNKGSVGDYKGVGTVQMNEK